MVQSRPEGLRGVLEGNFTACLLCGNFCAMLPNCHMQYNLSGSGLDEQTGVYERDDLRVTFLMEGHITL